MLVLRPLAPFGKGFTVLFRIVTRFSESSMQVTHGRWRSRKSFSLADLEHRFSPRCRLHSQILERGSPRLLGSLTTCDIEASRSEISAIVRPHKLFRPRRRCRDELVTVRIAVCANTPADALKRAARSAAWTKGDRIATMHGGGAKVRSLVGVRPLRRRTRLRIAAM